VLGMAYSKVTRTKKSFNDKIQSLNESTKESIGYLIANFENFSMEKYGTADLIPDLKKAEETEIYDVLQNWINWNAKLSTSTIQVYFSHLRKYLHYFGIKLIDQDIKAELTFKHKIQEERYGLKLLDIQSILKEMRYKNKVQYMCQLSSLMRIGEIIQLRKRHLILGQDNIIVKIPATIAKFSKARTTFFSKEASKLLIPILKNLNDSDLVFGSSNNSKVSAYQNKVNSQSATKQVLRLAVKKTGLTDTYESTGRYLINTHSFRAYGITKISRHDANFAKILAGQKGYLLQYDRMDDEEKLDLYQKFESELYIDNIEKLKKENQEKDKTIIELQEKETVIQELKKSQKEMKNRLDKIDLGEKLLKLFGESQEKLIEAIRNKEDSDKIFELMEKTNKLEKEYSDVAYESI